MKENSKVLALKYRPQHFEDLIGQQIVSETIQNSIKISKPANAYLFNGIRGVGKTTFARIIAKALNCKNAPEALCKENLCENCIAIINSSHIDVLEIDAASKTGVDDVRDLIEFSRYPPTLSNYKIFIIDEVHMLSKQAFNALLKTLEEPPGYLKFIFATTEIKKIPVTVLSRCQRFNLSRVKTDELFSFLKKISELEKIDVTEDALKLIVKISEGSVRDALSLLDRGSYVNFEKKKLDLKKAQEIFGYFDKSQIIEILKELLKGNEEKIIKKNKDLYLSGIDPTVFLSDFLEILYYLKNITYLKLNSTNYSLNDQELSELSKISKNVNNSSIFLMWDFTLKALNDINFVSNKNLYIEMFFIRLMYVKNNIKFKFPVEENKSESYVEESKNSSEKVEANLNLETKSVGQIKRTSQAKIEPLKKEKNENIISNIEDLIELCAIKKEVSLKYELENNVNLVNFNEQKIEISFNEKLDQNFIKNLTEKLILWTGKRWIILFSKEIGLPSKKEIEKSKKKENKKQILESKIYKSLKSKFDDIELIDILEKNK